MSHPIVNLADLELFPLGNGERYQARIGAIGKRLGAQQLGYNLTVLPPGKCAFPFHNHRVNEEMFYIVAGQGELRLGDARYPIRAGDVIACPAGGPEAAHQIANTSANTELHFLAVSTARSPNTRTAASSACWPNSVPAPMVSRNRSATWAASATASIIGRATEPFGQPWPAAR
jgi:uncharacterized cupin superfamily protein